MQSEIYECPDLHRLEARQGDYGARHHMDVKRESCLATYGSKVTGDGGSRARRPAKQKMKVAHTRNGMQNTSRYQENLYRRNSPATFTEKQAKFSSSQ